MFDLGIDRMRVDNDWGFERNQLMRCGCVLTMSRDNDVVGIGISPDCPRQLHDSTPGREGAAKYIDREIASIRKDLFG